MSRPQPSPEQELTWDQSLAWRVSRQHLDDPLPDPVRLASDLAGVQAQVPSSTLQVLTIRGTEAPHLDSLLRLQPFAGLSKAQLASIRDHVEDRYQGLLGSPDLVVTDAP